MDEWNPNLYTPWYSTTVGTWLIAGLGVGVVLLAVVVGWKAFTKSALGLEDEASEDEAGSGEDSADSGDEVGSEVDEQED